MARVERVTEFASEERLFQLLSETFKGYLCLNGMGASMKYKDFEAVKAHGLALSLGRETAFVASPSFILAAAG